MSVFFSDFPNSTHVSDYVILGKDCVIGEDTVIHSFCNLYGCTIGSHCMISTHIEIQRGVIIGDSTRIQSHSFLPTGTEIGNNVFISHGFCGVNDKFSNDKVNFESTEWGKIEISDDVIIGSSVTMFPCKVGKGAIVGANSLVIKDIGENEIWYGSPAKFIKMKS